LGEKTVAISKHQEKNGEKIYKIYVCSVIGREKIEFGI